MKILFISDTHGQHASLKLPKLDKETESTMLIHTGDISKRGKEDEVKDFLEWFEIQDYTYKIFIAGNHDFLFEMNPTLAESLVPTNCIYLNNSAVEIEGIKIWGSPITPRFFDWAFNCDRGEKIRQHWNQIPKDTDILLTHGPAYGILDQTIQGLQVGCEELSEVIGEIKPKIHAFGHIHEGYGMTNHSDTTFINASVLDIRYKLKNEPVLLDWKDFK
ncbi:metallophosphatase domain-containing protein [Bernardetia sp.]|uniref:metallophosphatase domain-containing protein n=1 Tax=Bernardetia sp. TaxID=1937974 RepID=UPI0025BC62FE|nr:metallophosphatase domain-containing protein [Bernardetia sp.]